MNIRKVFFCLLSFMVVSTQFAAGQYSGNPLNDQHVYTNYSIKTYTTHEGLPAQGTTSALKDKRGFMWIGTENGLCKFDGYTFKNLVNIPGDSTTLTSNYINALIEDNKGRIWVGTMDGLNLLDPLTEKFKRFYHKEADTRSLSNNKVWSLLCDQEGTVWIGTDNGFNQYADQTNSFVVYRPDPRNVHSMKGKSVNAIIDSRDGNLWLGNWSGGLNKFDKKNGFFTNYPQPQVPYQKNPNDVWSLCYDNDQIWVGTYWGGLYRFDRRTRKYTSFRSTYKDDIAAYSILKTGPEVLLVGGNNGFYWVNTATNNWKKLGAITNNADGSIYDDRNGIFWLCGKDGVTKLDNKQYKFDFMPFNIQPGEVKSIVMQGSWMWVASNKGLLRYDLKTGTKKLFTHTTNPNSLASSQINKLYIDLRGNLWLATEDGFDKYDDKKNTFVHHHHRSSLGSFFNEDVFRDILQINAHEYCLATDAGLKIYNDSTKQYVHYFNDDTKPHTLSNNHLYNLLKDEYGNIWIGTYGGGLNRFDPKTKKFYVYAFNDKLKGTISNNIIRDIYEDSHKNLWICTSDGLNKYDRRSDSFLVYSKNNGFTSNVFNNMVEDEAHHLWINTATGISEFNPANAVVKNFDEADGVYSHTAICKSASGTIYSAGNQGVVYFNPKKIKFNKAMPAVFITDFQIFNKTVIPGENSPLKQIITSAKEIRLTYDQSVISFEFVALNYTHSEKNEFAYLLEGFDKKFNYVGGQRKATYTNLNPGKYTFKVIASNNDGVWNLNGRALTLVITPPWYKTWWAYLLYAVLATGLIYVYLIYRDKQAKLKYEIKIAHFESEKEKELSEKKLSFFTNISHEFRTPLTLIINPVKELLYKDDKNIDTTSLNIVYRNAKRLLSLVDQLLLFRKADTGAGQLKISRFNLVTLCKEVYLCFTHQARMKHFRFDFKSPADNIMVFADREKIEIALFNLLSNAFKFTPDGGLISLSVTELGADAQIEVEDSGCGISANIGNQLFNRFYQVPNSGKSLKEGFGIGLYLVKSFIEDHDGTIKYSSTPGNGTTFCLLLPKGLAPLNYDTIEDDLGTSSVFLRELIEDEMAANALAEAAEEIICDEQPNAEAKCLLIIDDNREVREYVKQLFKMDYKIIEAGNGESGYNLIKEHLPDIVISDVMMPGMSGIELCNLVKEDMALSHIPMILLTASSSPEIKLKGIEGGADDYISKPFDRDLLKARVTSLLKSRNALQQYFYNEITLNTNTHKISVEYKSFLDNCIKTVEDHLKDPNLGTQMLADELSISNSSLYKKIKMISGHSANSFIRFVRLRRAAYMFIHTNSSISETAYAVGINDVKYFREQFKKLFNMNPSEYIKKYRKTFTNEMVNHTVNADRYKR